MFGSLSAAGAVGYGCGCMCYLSNASPVVYICYLLLDIVNNIDSRQVSPVHRDNSGSRTCIESLVHLTSNQSVVLHRIGADSMGAIAPAAKKLWGRCPQVAPTEILLSFWIQ